MTSLIFNLGKWDDNIFPAYFLGLLGVLSKIMCICFVQRPEWCARVDSSVVLAWVIRLLFRIGHFQKDGRLPDAIQPRTDDDLFLSKGEKKRNLFVACFGLVSFRSVHVCVCLT